MPPRWTAAHNGRIFKSMGDGLLAEFASVVDAVRRFRRPEPIIILSRVRPTQPSRTILVQPTIYGTDHRLLLDSLRGNENNRGVAVINDGVSDQEILDLHNAGIRGARFGLGNFIQTAPSRAAFEHAIDRIQALGWHAKIAAGWDDLLERESWLRSLDLPVVLDHFAGTDPVRGMDHAGFRLVLELLRGDNWWIMLSNGDRRSAGGPPWDDMIPFARAYVEAAPNRTIWASDWPHLRYAKPALPDDADLLRFLYRAVPDEDLVERARVSRGTSNDCRRRRAPTSGYSRWVRSTRVVDREPRPMTAL